MTTAVGARLAYSMATAVEVTGMSKSQLTRAIHSGALKARKSSVDPNGEPTGAYVLLAGDLAQYLDSLPEA